MLIGDFISVCGVVFLGYVYCVGLDWTGLNWIVQCGTLYWTYISASVAPILCLGVLAPVVRSRWSPVADLFALRVCSHK